MINVPGDQPRPMSLDDLEAVGKALQGSPLDRVVWAVESLLAEGLLPPRRCRMSILNPANGGQIVIFLARDVSTPQICEAIRSMRPAAMLRPPGSGV